MIQTTTDVTCDFVGCENHAQTLEPTVGSTMPRMPDGWWEGHDEHYKRRGNLCPTHVTQVFG